MSGSSSVSAKEKRISVASYAGSDISQSHGHSQKPALTSKSSSEHRPKFESFCIVRPPPHHLRHPANLQVQLINTGQGITQRSRSSSEFGRSETNISLDAVAQASVGGRAVHDATPPPSTSSDAKSLERTATGNATADEDDTAISLDPATAAGGGASLSRTASVRSNRSTTSLASSNASGSSMRKVMPCYNLEFHSLVPSVITDAGTDSKVAKIHKRGVELLDFAFLDPVLLGQQSRIPTLLQREEARKAYEAARPAAGSSTLAASDFKPANLLNKFKRFSFMGKPTPAASSAGQAPGLGDSTNKRNSVLSVASANTQTDAASSSTPTPSLIDIPAIPLFRDISPGDAKPRSGIENGVLTPPKKHAAGYVWIIRQYLRKDLKDTPTAEISFEWRKKRRRPTRSNNNDAASKAGNRRSTQIDNGSTPLASLASQGGGQAMYLRQSTGAPSMHVQKPSDDSAAAIRTSLSSDRPKESLDRRRSLSSNPSAANTPRASMDGERPTRVAELLSPNKMFKTRTGGSARSVSVVDNGASRPKSTKSPQASVSDLGHADEDSGEESDPEDSERPWICELVIKRPQTDSSLSLTTQRVLLGTLTPAPHHPKLVAHLAIPLSLAVVNISASSSASRKSSFSSSPFANVQEKPIAEKAKSASVREEQEASLELSVEELKDVTTVTALWLVVRESLGLGGIHKARKNAGDWRFTTPAALKRD